MMHLSRFKKISLVSVLVACLPLLGGCARTGDVGAPEQAVAGLIISGGPILTLGEPESVEAIAVGDGVILALGDRGSVERLRGPETVDVDLAGRVLAPAFVDHHVHLLNLGFSLLYRAEPSPTFVDLAGLGSLGAIGDEVRSRASALPAGTWILGQSWSQGAWGASELPSHEALSAAAPEHPVFFTRVDGHAGWANSEALRAAGIDARTPDPPGGVIARRRDRSPDGVLLERANELLRPVLPEPSPAEIRRAFRLAAEALSAQGVTEVFDAGFLGLPGIVDLSLDFERYLELLVEADLASPLPLRVHLMVPAPSPMMAQIAADPARYRQLTPRIGVTHVKLFADGALGSRGAWLSHSYADDPTTYGIERMSREEIRREAEAALDAGFDVATHAIGDAAVELALDVYAEILAERPQLAPGRLRIEHFSYAGPADFDRAAALGIVLAVNPDFVAPDDHGLAMEDARVGVDNSDRVYALGRMAAAGADLAFGSDYFTAPAQPLLGFYAATTRQNGNGLPADGWQPGERLSRIDSLRIQTRLWPAGGGGPRRGALAVGGRADLVVLTGDPLAVEASAILGIQVEATHLDGAVVFDARSAGSGGEPSEG
jgi:predicted amidohydrolase YtcJ